MTIELGYLLPTRERIVIDVHETGPILALADRAEAVGRDAVWIGDSLLAKPRHEPLALIAAIAMQIVVARRHLGVATSFGQCTRSSGGAVGVALLGAVIAGSLPLGEEPPAVEMTVAIHRAFWFATLVSALAVVSAIRIPAGLPADLVHPDHEPDERPQEAGDRRQEAGGQKAEGREADGESAA